MRRAARLPRLLVGLALLGGAGAAHLAQNPAARPELDFELGTWLPRLDRVASLYRGTALSFTCTELISWIAANGKGQRARFEYVYVVDAEKGLKDYRMDPSVRGEIASTQEVNPGAYGVPRYVENGFSWIVLFQKARWPDHRYEYLGEGRALDRQAVRIGFRPIAPYRKGVNEWEGEAWIDRTTAQILRVEARRPVDFLMNSDQVPPTGEIRSRREGVSVEFGVEKNEMRFPSLIRLEIFRADAGSDELRAVPGFHVEQEYRRHRFFEVRTAAEIHDFVFGNRVILPDGTTAPP